MQTPQGDNDAETRLSLVALFGERACSVARCTHVAIDLQQRFTKSLYASEVAKFVGGTVAPAFHALGVETFWIYTANRILRRPEWKHGKFHDALHQADGDRVVAKESPSGFLGTKLDELLRTGGKDILLISGLFARACIRDTALEARARNYKVCVIEDAVDRDPEALAELHAMGIPTITAVNALSALRMPDRNP